MTFFKFAEAMRNFHSMKLLQKMCCEMEIFERALKEISLKSVDRVEGKQVWAYYKKNA